MSGFAVSFSLKVPDTFVLSEGDFLGRQSHFCRDFLDKRFIPNVGDVSFRLPQRIQELLMNRVRERQQQQQKC